MKKGLFKVSTFVIAIIIAVSSFSFGAFAENTNLTEFECPQIQFGSNNVGRENYSPIEFIFGSSMPDCKNPNGIYCTCHKLFTSKRIDGYIYKVEHDDPSQSYDYTFASTEFETAEINPYDYYDIVVSEGTFANDEKGLINKECICDHIPGYQILGQDEPKMFELINILRNIFSFAIK
jgi:hypothetical protein